MTLSENPSKLGWPSLHADHWNPFWTACIDEGVVVCLHIGSSSQLVITASDAPIDCLITLSSINIVQAATDLVWSPVLRAFPDVDGVVDHDIDRVTHLNAMKHFSYDPFTALGGRESCTVGALRARAAGHDVSIRSTNASKVGKHAARSVDLSVPGGS